MSLPHVSENSVSIARATSDDSAGILRCLAAAFEVYRERYTPEAYLDTVLNEETLCKRMSEMAVFVAKDAERQIVGTIACQPAKAGEGHLRGMAVLPECLGMGIARRLLKAAEEELRSARCTHVTLDTTEPLRRAIRFYEKHGYQQTGRIQDFFGMALYEYSKRLDPKVPQ